MATSMSDRYCKVGFTGKKITPGSALHGRDDARRLFGEPACERGDRAAYEGRRLQGILDIGYRFDHRDNEYKLLDVNPRIGGTFRLFVGADGMDVLRALYLDLTGPEVAPTGLQDGRRWIVEPLDIASSIAYARRGDLTLGRWLRSLAGYARPPGSPPTIPLPFLAMWIWVLFSRLPRALRLD